MKVGVQVRLLIEARVKVGVQVRLSIEARVKVGVQVRLLIQRWMFVLKAKGARHIPPPSRPHLVERPATLPHCIGALWPCGIPGSAMGQGWANGLGLGYRVRAAWIEVRKIWVKSEFP